MKIAMDCIYTAQNEFAHKIRLKKLHFVHQVSMYSTAAHLNVLLHAVMCISVLMHIKKQCACVIVSAL